MQNPTSMRLPCPSLTRALEAQTMTQRYKELEDLRSQVDELRAWSDLTGQPLPMHPCTIVLFERMGAVVDLVDETVTFQAADARRRIDVRGEVAA